MKIISIRRGFASDHSSTSYEFLAVDKPLSKKDRLEVSRLSKRVNPTARRANFIYNVDGYDIPGGWKDLMVNYYDVMYREEYSWWTLVMAFNAAPGQYEALLPYEFVGTDDLGVYISSEGERIIVTINCVVEPGALDSDHSDYYEEDDDEVDDEEVNSMFNTDDDLLNMLIQIRQQIISGDYRALYAVWEKYGDQYDEESKLHPPKPEERKTGGGIINDFENLLGFL